MKGKLAFLEDWYEWVKHLARHKRAEPALFGVSFVESSFFPIPPDVMLIPMVQARKDRAWRYAFICSVASVLGGILGYFIGLWFFNMFGESMLGSLGKDSKISDFQNFVDDWGAMGVFAAALTPFPYKVITITSGWLQLNFGYFIAASVVGRSLRFFLVAGVVKKFGDQAEKIMKEHFGKFTIGLCVFLILLYLALKMIMKAMGLSH